jgi:hypothetical protein
MMKNPANWSRRGHGFYWGCPSQSAGGRRMTALSGVTYQCEERGFEDLCDELGGDRHRPSRDEVSFAVAEDD